MQLDSHRRQSSFLDYPVTEQQQSPISTTTLTPTAARTLTAPYLPHPFSLTTTNNNYNAMPCSTSTTNTTAPSPRSFCRWSSSSRRARRCGRASCSDEEIETNDEGVKMQSWLSVRRENMRRLRKNTRHVVLLMAMIEAMRVGPIQIVYAGKDGYAARGPEDYGIAYNIGYFLSWLYVCLFMIVFVPLFSWWIPNSSVDESADPSFMSRFDDYLKSFNMLLLPFTIGICLASHIWHTIATIIYVDARPMGTRTFPANNKKNWLVRSMLLGCVAMSMSFGYGAFQILESMDLAHVKAVEYYIIVLPIQTNIGLMIGSVMQWKVAKRAEKLRLAAMAEQAGEEAIVADEKKALIEVQGGCNGVHW